MIETTASFLTDLAVVPVVTIGALREVDAIADGLVHAGIGSVEITLRTPHGMGAIRRMAARGDLVVGAGTVLNDTAVRSAADAGARFVVSPGIDERLVHSARECGLMPLPGVATATEIQQAHRLRLRQVKVFPISTLGGLAWIDALHAPFPDMRFMPSGGVTAESLPAYLRHPAVFAAGVSWLVPRSRGADLYETVRTRCRELKDKLDSAAPHG